MCEVSITKQHGSNRGLVGHCLSSGSEGLKKSLGLEGTITPLR
jgi:hypothetical protein